MRLFSPRLRHTLLIATAILLVAGCDSDDDTVVPMDDPEPMEPPPPPVVVTIDGDVTKGPVAGATINVFAVDATGMKTGDPIATAMTDAEGLYTIELTDFVGVYLVEATGGTYTDEATGGSKTIPEDEPLRAVSSIEATEDTTITATVTPLTEIAVQIAEERDGGLSEENVDASNEEVGSLFFGDVEDPAAVLLNTRPADVTDEDSANASDEERLYGLMLGAIAELEEDEGNLRDAVTRIADDIADDGNLDETAAELIQAGTDFIEGDINNSGIDSAERVSDLLDAAAEGVDAVIDQASGTDITAFSFDGALRIVINGETHTVEILMPNGTDLGTLADPLIATSIGSTIAPVDGEDFSEDVEYDVTAEDTTVQTWVVTVLAAESDLSPLSDIIAVSHELVQSAVINSDRRTVVGSVATRADLLVLAETDPADIFTFSEGASFEPSDSSIVDGAVMLTIFAADQSSSVWEILFRVNADQVQSDFAIEGEDTTVPLLEEIFQLGVVGRFDQIVTWSSSDESVATVDEFGVVTFVSAGTVDITASVPGFSTEVLDFGEASDSITLTIVRSEQDELSFEFEGIETVVGEEEDNPIGGGSGTGDITFSSSDETVATVDADGVVTTVGAGEAIISAVKAGDDAFLESNTASFAIVVELREQSPLTFESGLIQFVFGEEVPANPLMGGDGTGAVTFTINDENIATINPNGVVTAVAPGFTFVSAVKAGDGTFGPSNTANYELLISEESAECVFDQSAWDDCELSQ